MPGKSDVDPHATPPLPDKGSDGAGVSERGTAHIQALATLAAGVAHEINNPLGYLRANLEFIQLELKKLQGINPELLAAISDAIDGSERIASAVQAASLFGQHDRGGIGPTSVNKLVETALRMAWPHLGRSAKLEKVLDPVPEVLANEARLAQVVFQLLVHAADSMLGLEGKHTLWVRTRYDPQTNEVVIEVEDDGPGLSPYEARRAFDPVASVNARADGALGLPFCYRLVGSMGGGMSLLTAPNQGRKVRVHLPAVSPLVRPQ
ncbi:MAG: HAMP domain-containing sensor histidine kinase [Myxococcaceae bacterium]